MRSSFPRPSALSGWRREPGSSETTAPTTPKNWERPFGTGDVHIGLSAFSDSEEKRRRVLAIAREQFEGFPGHQGAGQSGLQQPNGSRSAQGRRRTSHQSRAVASSRRPAADGRSRQASSFSVIRVKPASHCQCLSRTSSAAMAPTSASANIRSAPQRLQSIPPREWTHRIRTGAAAAKLWSAVGAAAPR